ncbi:MAG: sulfotransferase family 2 domain-containing protein [Gammaproteobacteria bacterium]|nr:sulfotransferase family 2 domain-containing protein [Gammaproteobacteria bacterium]
MIVSHQHRFIFFAVPRTATHSVRQTLRAHLGAEDWEQQMLTARQTLPVQELADLGHGHISARQARTHLPDDVWHSYFKFAFVRNPFDRFVSVCCFLNRGRPEFSGNEAAFMKRALSRPQFRRRVLVIPQTRLLMDAGGRSAMNYIGCYESLQSSYDEVCRHLGIPATSLTPANASAHHDYARYYDDELTQAVADFYAEDFAAFGYPRRPAAAGDPP